MLTELHVRDLALVEDVWLEFGSGLTALTGETGAGKTVLVSALKLLLGERADATLVREGASEALVEGRFVIGDREVVVRRRLTAEGRSKCTVDGEMATVAMLGELLGGHVDLHGQHEHQALLSPARHAAYLDRFIGQTAGDAVERYRMTWAAAKSARQRLDELERALADRDRRADYLRFVLSEIDAASVRPGEYEELEARLPRLRHAGRLTEVTSTAWSAIRDEGGASEGLSAALAALGGAHGLDPALDELAEAIRAIDVDLQEVSSALRSYVESVEHDPGALDASERRMQQLSDLARKYGGDMDGVLSARAEAEREVTLLDQGEAGRAKAEAEKVEADLALREAGQALCAVRDAAVTPFTAALAAAAAELALPSATFDVSRTPLEFADWTGEGPERVEFLFSSGVGESPRPLSRVASGGEISRVMLALKSVLGSADAVPVLVFDEVDAGIGGATALSVGRRLASLSEDHQVLVVTHLPQVAAFADTHVVVSKEENEGRTVTSARQIDGNAIVIEMARMLSGSASDTGMAHARELLESAGRAVKG